MEKTIPKLHESRISNAEVIKDNLICKSCNNLVTGFIMACMNCNYKLCHKCYIEYANKNEVLSCAGCKSSDPYTPKKISEEELRLVLVQCKYLGKGCTITPSFLDYLKHEEECDYRLIQCKECKKEMLFKDENSHIINDCPEVFINCAICKNKMLRKDLVGHQQKGECFNILSSCLNCHRFIPIKDLKSHRAFCNKQIAKCQTCNIVKQGHEHDCLLELTKNTLSKVNYIKNSINDQKQDHETERAVQIECTQTIERHLTENVREGNESIMQLKKELKEDHSLIINEESSLAQDLHNMRMEIINQRDVTMNLLESNRMAILKQGAELEQKIDNSTLVVLKEYHEIQESSVKSNEELINQRNEINAKFNRVDFKLNSHSEVISQIDTKLKNLIEAFNDFKDYQIRSSKIERENINDLIRNSQVYKDRCREYDSNKEVLEAKFEQAQKTKEETENENQKLRAEIKENETRNKELKDKESQLQEAIQTMKINITTEKNEILKLNERIEKQMGEKDNLSNQLKDKSEINSKLIDEHKNIIQFINSETEIKYGAQNLGSYIKEVISHFQEKIKKKETNLLNEKSVLLKNCITILQEFKEELPNDIQEIPEIVKKLLNKQQMLKQELAKGTRNIPEDIKVQKIEEKKEVKIDTKIKEVEIKDKKDEKIVMKYKNYEDAFNQIVKGKKIRPEIAKMIESGDKWWHLEKKDNEPTKDEILNILELVKYSDKIQKLTFTENPNFDGECERAYLNAIKVNNSIITILLCKTSVSKEVTLEFLKLLETKPKIKVLVIEKEKIEKKVAQELSEQIKLDIDRKINQIESIAKLLRLR